MAEETLAEPVDDDEALKLLEKELKALQQALDEENAKEFGTLEIDRVEKLEEQIEAKQAELEAKKAAIENARQAADDAEIESKRRRLSELEEQGRQAMSTDKKRAREIQSRFRETKQELDCLEEQRAKRARSAPGGSGGAV